MGKKPSQKELEVIHTRRLQAKYTPEQLKEANMAYQLYSDLRSVTTDASALLRVRERHPVAKELTPYLLRLASQIHRSKPQKLEVTVVKQSITSPAPETKTEYPTHEVKGRSGQYELL